MAETTWGVKFTFNINNQNLEGTYNRGKKRLYLTVGGLTQYSDTSKAYGRWSLLQMLHRHYASSLYVNELHLAIDLPYYYSDIKVKPEACVFQPSFSSTRYFDVRRGKGKALRFIDDFVIYDKCRKCRIGSPLTRIELRFKKSVLSDIIDNTVTQQTVAHRIGKKFKEIKIHKGRSSIKIDTCDWLETITVAMNFIIDSNQYTSVLMHRSDEVQRTGEVFKDFMRFCAKNHIYTSKPQISSKVKVFLSDLTPQERQMLNRTIASYNAYDKKWHEDTRFKMKGTNTARTRLTDRLKEEILLMVQQGQTQASISEELSVSESTISRWLDGCVWLRDSRAVNIISFE